MAVAETMTAEDLPALREYHQVAVVDCAPATPKEVGLILARLFSHYPPRNDLSPALSDQRMGDWFRDLAEYPADVLEASAAAWRRSKERFAPSPGQFIAKANEIFAARRAYRDRAGRVLDALTARLDAA